MVPFLTEGLPLLCALALLIYRVWRGAGPATQVAVLLLGLAWLSLDKDFEGPILIPITRNHSMVTADLVTLLAFLAVALRWFWKAPSPPSDDTAHPAEPVHKG